MFKHLFGFWGFFGISFIVSTPQEVRWLPVWQKFCWFFFFVLRGLFTFLIYTKSIFLSFFLILFMHWWFYKVITLFNCQYQFQLFSKGIHIFRHRLRRQAGRTILPAVRYILQRWIKQSGRDTLLAGVWELSTNIH